LEYTAYIGIDIDSRNQKMKHAAFAALADKVVPEVSSNEIFYRNAGRKIESIPKGY